MEFNMSSILSSFFKKANLGTEEVKQFIDNGSAETISHNTETGLTSTDPQTAPDGSTNRKPAYILSAISTNNEDTKIVIPITKKKQAQPQMRLTYSETAMGREVDRFAKALFSPTEKELTADKYFSKKLVNLDKIKDDASFISRFDSSVGLFEYGPQTKLQNCFNLEQLLNFEANKTKEDLSALRKAISKFMDNMQATPDLTKITKPYVSGSVKGFTLLDTFESTEDTFIVSEICLDSSNKTKLCIIPSRKAVEMSDLFAPDMLQSFAEVTEQGAAAFYIHDKKMRLQFVYAFLKCSLANVQKVPDLELKNGKTDFITAMSNFFDDILDTHFEKSKVDFVKYILGLYRFCSNYEAYIEYSKDIESHLVVKS